MPSTTVLNARDFLYIAPEIVLTAWGLLVVLVDVGLLRRRSDEVRRRILGEVALVGVLAAILAQLPVYLPRFLPGRFAALEQWTSGATDPSLFFGTIGGDDSTIYFNIAVLLMLGLVFAMSMAWGFTERWGEYYALLCWAAVGMMLLIASEELLTLFLTLETMTLCLYLATAIETGRRRSAEGGLKYFVYGSVSSALFLFGLSLIYGLTGTTRLDAINQALRPEVAYGALAVSEAAAGGLAHNIAGATAVLLVMVGFGFKVAAVPFHQWAPDAYEGAPAPVTAWIASGSKIASFIAMMKVFVFALGPWARQSDRVLSPGWIGLVAMIAAATMTYGNFAALAQRSLKRMLAYSSIAHAGYLMVGVLAAAISVEGGAAAGSVLFYLIVYGVSTVGAFAVAAWLARDVGREDIDDLNGLGSRSPGLAVCIVILMLSLIGMPPLAGFFGKVYMFMEALNAGERGRLTMVWLVALGLFNSVVSAFYYVRVLKAMFFQPPNKLAPARASWLIATPIVAATLLVVAFGLYPSGLVDRMALAAIPMLSSSSGSFEPTPVGPRPKRPRPPEDARAGGGREETGDGGQETVDRSEK